MKHIHIVITGNGDGSNSLYFFKDTPKEKLKNLDEETGDYEKWGSGDGVQITTLTFPDNFDLESLGVRFDDEKLEELL